MEIQTIREEGKCSTTPDVGNSSKLVDYEQDDSSLEPGEVVTPPRLDQNSHADKSVSSEQSKDQRKEDVCKEKVQGLPEIDAFNRQEGRKKVNKTKSDNSNVKQFERKDNIDVEYTASKRIRTPHHNNHRGFNTYNSNQDGQFHGQQRNRQFNARRGRGYMRTNMHNHANHAYERNSPVRWSNPSRDIPESELLWTKAKPSISYWFKGCKEIINNIKDDAKKLNNEHKTHKILRSKERDSKKSKDSKKSSEKLRKTSKNTIDEDLKTKLTDKKKLKLNEHKHTDNLENDDDEEDPWDELFQKSLNNRIKINSAINKKPDEQHKKDALKIHIESALETKINKKSPESTKKHKKSNDAIRTPPRKDEDKSREQNQKELENKLVTKKHNAQKIKNTQLPKKPICPAAFELLNEIDIFEDDQNKRDEINLKIVNNIEIKNEPCTPPPPSNDKELHTNENSQENTTTPQKMNEKSPTKNTLTNNQQITSTPTSNKNSSNADDFDVLSIADLREQEAAEDRAKSLKVQTSTKTTTPIRNSSNTLATADDTVDSKRAAKETLLSDVSKDFKKLKALDNNLQRLQKMRESFDPIDDIWEELCKMESLFQKQKNFILLKYAKTENVTNLISPTKNAVSKATTKKQMNGNSVISLNSKTEDSDEATDVQNMIINNSQINLVEKEQVEKLEVEFNVSENSFDKGINSLSESESADPLNRSETESVDTGFLSLNSERETIKLKISPIKKPKIFQLNKKPNVLKQLWDDDDDEDADKLNADLSSLESSKEAVKMQVEKVTRPMKGVAIVKPIMEGKYENSFFAKKQRDQKHVTNERRERRSRSISPTKKRNTQYNQRRYQRSFSRSPNRNWPRRNRNSPQFRRRNKNYRRSQGEYPCSSLAKRPRTPTYTPPRSQNSQTNYTYKDSSYSRSPSGTPAPTFFKPPSPPTACSTSPETPPSWSHEKRTHHHFRPRSPVSPRRSSHAARSLPAYGSPMYNERAFGYENIVHIKKENEFFKMEPHEYDIAQDINGYYYNMQTQTPTAFGEATAANQAPNQSIYNSYLPTHFYDSDREIYANMTNTSVASDSGILSFTSYTTTPHTNINQSVLKELTKAPANAVQKGNVLEIVPIQNADLTNPMPENIGVNKIEFKENFAEKSINKLSAIETQAANAHKTMNMKWKEEVINRQMQASVLRTLPSKSTILKVNKTNQADQEVNNEGLPKKQLLKQKLNKKKVFFEDGIYPSRDSSDEDRKAVDEMVMRKVKRLRKKLSEKQLKVLRQVAPQLDDDNISAELDSLQPPGPPEGTPPAHLRQPIYLRSVSPDNFVFFHYDAEVASMFVSAYEHAIPPRLLDAKNKANVSGEMTTSMIPFMTPHLNHSLKTENNKMHPPAFSSRVPTAISAAASSNATLLGVRNAVESPPPVKPLSNSRNEFVTQPLYPTSGPLMPYPPPIVPGTPNYYKIFPNPYNNKTPESIDTLLNRAMPIGNRHTTSTATTTITTNPYMTKTLEPIDQLINRAMPVGNMQNNIRHNLAANFSERSQI